ncbi:MAG: hypothetical protein ACPG19_11110 [Saprospiraceae bacterium]
MDNKLIETDLVERYVLNQLSDEELALFRGRLMFDETLRKQVVETKMLINNLQTIAKGNGFGAPKTSTAPTAINSGWSKQRILSAAAIAAGIVLITMVAIKRNTTSTDTISTQKIEISPNTEQAIDKVTPIASQTKKEEKEEKEVKASKEVATPKVEKAKSVKTKQNKTTIATPSDDVDNDEERIFAQSSPSKSIDLSALEEEAMSSGSPSMGFADNQAAYDDYPKNEFLEDVITNSTSKSSAVNVILKEGKENSFVKDKNGAIDIVYHGMIETKAKNSQYRFKIFTNDMDEYLDNMPKYQTHLKTSKVENKDNFDLDFKIDLPKGLYYYIIEEEVNGEYDMIYANKFIVRE